MFPAKGPWLRSMAELQLWLGALASGSTSAMLLDRVVQVPAAETLRESAEEENVYKVLTGPIGFANHFRGLDRRANCRLEWRGEGKGLGEHSLVVVTSMEVKGGKELLLDYGTSHAVGRKRMPGPKKDRVAKRIRAAKAVVAKT